MGSFFPEVSYDAPWGLTQDQYLPLQSTHARSFVPHNSIASIDSSIRAAQSNEESWTSSPVVPITQSPAVPPFVRQVSPHDPFSMDFLSSEQQRLLSLPPPASASIRYWVQVPQRVYDLGPRQWAFERSEPISFSVNGFPGMNMQEAYRKHFTGLDGRDDPMFRNSAGAISCRFMFPGYPLNSSGQISTLGWAKHRSPITRSKLAHEIAKKLNNYLESMAGHPMEDSAHHCWKIGEGFMRLENMYLVRLVHVSMGSFQPEIWVTV